MSNDYKSEQGYLDSLAARIVQLRKAKGMTQEKLAAEANIDRVALANIETGKRRPTVTTIYRLSRALGVKAEEFFTGLG
jgi:transcriptional regulator with XRE-family HTH domain